MVKDKMVAIQAKFTLEQSHIDFLEQFRERGFKDKSSIVRMAIDKLHQELDRQDLAESAELYAQIYAEDEELRQLTDAAIGNWPE
jgi:Arc/MetJ-type ribon-helix-helix transcriptional regulator